jgi:hypothetical protein
MPARKHVDITHPTTIRPAITVAALSSGTSIPKIICVDTHTLGQNKHTSVKPTHGGPRKRLSCARLDVTGGAAIHVRAFHGDVRFVMHPAMS